MKLADFLIQEEGNDSKRLPDGRFASTWDPLGRVWNIGSGITVGVTKDTVWTQAQLNAAEAKEFADVEACVTRCVKVKITENQRVALESLAYNIGDAGFEHSSVLRAVNAGHMAEAAQDFLLWNHAGGKVCPGLIKRRKDEIRLFNHPDDVPVPADLRAVKTPLTATMKSEISKMDITATTTVLPTALPIPTAGINVSKTTQATGLAGVGIGAILTTALPIVAALAPNLVNPLIAGLSGLGGLGVLVSSIWGMFHINSAASANTLSLVNSVTSVAQQAASALQAATSPQPAAAS